MAIQKIGKIWLGDGDLSTGTYSEITSGTAVPSDLSGADGDVYVRVAGANSNFYQKRNGSWTPLLELAINVTLPDNTASFVFLALAAAAARFIRIEYGITRAANQRQGVLAVTNDLVDVAVSESDVQSLGAGDVGVEFDAQINGSNVELQSTTDNQGTSASLKYFIRSWS